MIDIEQEIEAIRHELSVTIPDELHDAMYSGEVLESSEYSEILTRQHFLSVRLSQLNRRLNLHKTIDIRTIPRNQIGVGSILTLQCNNTGEHRTVKIIATEMSDIDTDYEEITLTSPMGKTLLNKHINDEIVVYTPSGIKNYTVISLQTIHDSKNTT